MREPHQSMERRASARLFLFRLSVSFGHSLTAPSRRGRAATTRFATIVHAKSIGKNCSINQQVTIGFNGAGKFPVIGDNVSIRAGAKVLGDIVLGDNVIVGAGAVVTKSVPPNCVVVGVPAYIIKRDGIRCKEELT